MPNPDDGPMETTGKPSETGYVLQLYPAAGLRVTSGANLGDPVGPPEDLCDGDVYQLSRDALALSLRLTHPEGKTAAPVVAPGSQVGARGDTVDFTARLTMMAPDGDTVELMVLHHPASGGYFALPMTPITARTDYTLLRCEARPTDIRLLDIACVSFTRGTMITLADGRQMGIEALTPGDRVLTRDHGPQPLRWIGRATLRAIGSFAPVVISKGTLGNAGDLIVSQQHRVFLYHRKRHTGIRTAELLVQAKHLVDNEAVFLREGGFVDYFSLVFDRHEIIYAEGIPVESLMVNDTTVARLPAGLSAEVRARFPGLSQNQHFGTEPDADLLSELGPHGLYKKGTPG